jgi:hypothetical protein
MLVANAPAVVVTSPVNAGMRAANRVPEFRFPAFPAASVVALPTLVTSPVKLAFVVTWPAVRPEAVPVRFVATPDDGVPTAPPLTMGEPAVPTATLRAVATPVPNPVMFPTAGVIVTVVAAVIRPFPLVVICGTAVVLPNVPTLALTVASVVATAPA